MSLLNVGLTVGVTYAVVARLVIHFFGGLVVYPKNLFSFLCKYFSHLRISRFNSLLITLTILVSPLNLEIFFLEKLKFI